MIEPKKNRLWIFDVEARKQFLKRYGKEIRIIEVFSNPDSFRFGSFSKEEIGTWEELDEEINMIGRATVYVVFGIDPRDGSRAKCVKYSETEYVNSDNGEQGQR